MQTFPYGFYKVYIPNFTFSLHGEEGKLGTNHSPRLETCQGCTVPVAIWFPYANQAAHVFVQPKGNLPKETFPVLLFQELLVLFQATMSTQPPARPKVYREATDWETHRKTRGTVTCDPD